jgi:hypothetical protein
LGIILTALPEPLHVPFFKRRFSLNRTEWLPELTMHASPKSGLCWKADEAHVTVEMVVANLMKNAATAKAIVAAAIPQIPAETNWPCHAAMKNAIMTDRKVWPKQTVAELKPILAKFLYRHSAGAFLEAVKLNPPAGHRRA